MEAYITLISTDSYAPGAIVLARQLLDLQTSKSLACLITPNVSEHVRQLLRECQYIIIQVDPIYTTRPDNLALLGRPDLDATLTKIQLWRLSQYKKLVFLDADTFPLRNIDELFDRPAFAAAPDVGWPDCFNSGVFVAEPSERIYNELIQMAAEKGSFDGGDQGLLNSYFHNWPETNEHRLAFTYNTTPSAAYSYVPAFLEFKDTIAVVHFIGRDKPWHAQRFADGSVFRPNGPIGELVQKWWNVWDNCYGRHILPENLVSPTANTTTNNNANAGSTADSYSVTPPRWLDLAPPPTSTSWDMEAIQRDVDHIAARMHIPRKHEQHHHQQPKKTHTTRPHLFLEPFSPRQDLQKRPSVESLGTAASPPTRFAWPGEPPSQKRCSRTPSPSWSEQQRTTTTTAEEEETHHPWDNLHHYKGINLSWSNLPKSAGPSSPWEELPRMPAWQDPPPQSTRSFRDQEQEQAEGSSAAMAQATTPPVSSIWHDMATSSFSWTDKRNKSTTPMSSSPHHQAAQGTTAPSIWNDLASPRAMAFSWNDDLKPIGSPSSRKKERKMRLRQDEQKRSEEGLEGRVSPEVIEALDKPEQRMTGEVAKRKHKGKMVHKSDVETTKDNDNNVGSGGPGESHRGGTIGAGIGPSRSDTMATDHGNQFNDSVSSSSSSSPRVAGSPSFTPPTSTNVGRGRSPLGSFSSNFKEAFASKVDRSKFTNPFLPLVEGSTLPPTNSNDVFPPPSPKIDPSTSPMYTTRRMSTGPSSYTFSQSNAVAEATMLEFELDHQDQSTE